MLTTPELIVALERRGVLPPGDVARIRQLYENSPTEFVPRVMFKWLVSRGRISPEQAEQLLSADMSLSAAAALDRILGVNDDLAIQDDDDEARDEDTKDLLVDDAADLTLAPPGTAPFADSPTSTRKSLIPEETPDQPAPAAPSPAVRPAAKVEPARPAAAELIDELFADAGATGAGVPRGGLPLRRPAARSRWESPLMLVGGGALLLLLGVGSFLVWRVVREGGDAAFASAEEVYNSGSYAAAVERYDQFIADHPRHRLVGQAVVHQGMARLRAAVEAGADWPGALDLAKQILPQISERPEFALSKTDLAALLPDIAENLAKQAAAPTDASAPATTAQAVEARELIEQYVSSTSAIEPRLQEIDGLIAAAERRLSRQALLAATIAAVHHAAAARDLDEAAKARATLLVEFPDAINDPKLAEAMAALAETKRQGVRFAAVDDPAAVAATPSQDILQRVTLAHCSGGTVAEVDDVVFALIEGTLFALNAGDGRILWTRFVGFDATLPTPVDLGGGRDAAFYDAAAKALVRVDANDGTVRWQQPAAASNQFILERDRAYVVVDRQILFVDLTSGGVTGRVNFPTDLAATPVSDPRGRVRYQLGRADDLYVISNVDSRCLQAYYVGHAPGAIAVPPTCVGSYVLLAENVGEQTRLRLLEAGSDGAGLKEVAVRMLDGRTTLPPQVSQRLTTVVTNGGPVELFDLSGAGDRKPLDPVARLTTPSDRIVRRHFVFRGTQLWLGGNGLAHYEFQPNLNKLTPIRTVLDDRTTLQAPQLIGNAVVCRAQPSDFVRPASVLAVDAGRGTVIWETGQLPDFVGSPHASSDGKMLTYVTADGLVYDVPGDATGTLDKPTLQLGGDVESFAPAAFADDRRVFVVADRELSRQRLVMLAPVGAEPRTVTTEPLGIFTQPPTAYRDGILIPAQDGQLHYLDPATGRKKAEPFQPPNVGGKGTLSRAVVVGDDVLVQDDQLYRLTSADGDAPYLKVRAEYDVGLPLGVVGPTAYVPTAIDELTAYAVNDFQPGQSHKFRGARDWRATVVGERLLAAARLEPIVQRKEVLVCLTADAVAWQTTLERTPSASRFFPPIRDGDDYLIVDDLATVIRLDGATGKQTARVALGRPLAAPPRLAGDRLVLTTQAGEVLWVAQP